MKKGNVTFLLPRRWRAFGSRRRKWFDNTRRRRRRRRWSFVTLHRCRDAAWFEKKKVGRKNSSDFYFLPGSRFEPVGAAAPGSSVNTRRDRRAGVSSFAVIQTMYNGTSRTVGRKRTWTAPWSNLT